MTLIETLVIWTAVAAAIAFGGLVGSIVGIIWLIKEGRQGTGSPGEERRPEAGWQGRSGTRPAEPVRVYSTGWFGIDKE